MLRNSVNWAALLYLTIANFTQQVKLTYYCLLHFSIMRKQSHGLGKIHTCYDGRLTLYRLLLMLLIFFFM